MYYYNFPCS